MWKIFLFLTGLCFSIVSFAQKKNTNPNSVEDLIRQQEIEAHLSFLAADEMRGRNAGSPELNIAANYIKAYFKANGAKALPGAENYFQPVEQLKNSPATSGSFILNNQSYLLKESLLVLEGDSTQWKGNIVYAGYGSAEELSKLDIKGKMVLSLAGSRDADNLNKVFVASSEKYKLVQKSGGLGLVEILALPQAPWPGLVNYLSQTIWSIKREGTVIPHLWLKPSDLASIKFEQGQSIPATIQISGKKHVPVPGKNVVGYFEGTDPKLKEEYIIVTAHYDHVGVQKSKDSQDSIYNGARDNAIGTVALLETAKYLSKNPTKHSVILVALTSEEKGLLGSQWYTEHPLLPLNKHILDINCDGVGYNDTSIITSISLGRTNTDAVVTKVAQNYGLKVGGDPDPKEGFFDRSDQVSFARKGVPAIKLQPGLKEMNDEIKQYYHRAADEVGSLNFEYLTKFYKTFVHTVYSLANETQRPAWKAGDKYEEASKTLYGAK